jgi:hypothetical protein
MGLNRFASTNKKQASLYNFFTKTFKKVLPVKHLWESSQSSASEVSQPSVVTGKKLQYVPSPNILDLSQELSQSSVYFNGMQGHRQPSEEFLDVSTSTIVHHHCCSV